MSSDTLATVIGQHVEKIIYKEPVDQYLADVWESLGTAMELMDKNCGLRDVSITYKATLEQYFLSKVLATDLGDQWKGTDVIEEDEDTEDPELDETVATEDLEEEDDRGSERDIDPNSMNMIERARYYADEIMAMRKSGAKVSEIIEKYNIGEGTFHRLRKEILG